MIQVELPICLTHDFAQDVQHDVRIIKPGRMVRGIPSP